jgi:hypothetical protein
MIFAIDFDGTIVKNEWPNIGKLRWLAKPVLQWMKRRGHTLILWTCRVCNEERYLGNQCPLCSAYCFLEDNGIKFNYINENPPERIKLYNNDCRKIGADWYIDDKAGFWGWWTVVLIVLWLEWRKRK